jgi:hypothetical protein
MKQMCKSLVAPDEIFKTLKIWESLVNSSNVKMYADHDDENLRKVCSFKKLCFSFCTIFLWFFPEILSVVVSVVNLTLFHSLKVAASVSDISSLHFLFKCGIFEITYPNISQNRF